MVVLFNWVRLLEKGPSMLLGLDFEQTIRWSIHYLTSTRSCSWVSALEVARAAQPLANVAGINFTVLRKFRLSLIGSTNSKWEPESLSPCITNFPTSPIFVLLSIQLKLLRDLCFHLSSSLWRRKSMASLQGRGKVRACTVSTSFVLLSATEWYRDLQGGFLLFRPKNGQTLRKSWRLKLFCWDLLCNLTQ